MNRRLEDQIIGKVDNERKDQNNEVHKGKPKPQKAKVKTQAARY